MRDVGLKIGELEQKMDLEWNGTDNPLFIIFDTLLSHDVSKEKPKVKAEILKYFGEFLSEKEFSGIAQAWGITNMHNIENAVKKIRRK